MRKMLNKSSVWYNVQHDVTSNVAELLLLQYTEMSF